MTINLKSLGAIATLALAALAPAHAADGRAALARLALTAAGLDEAITYGFTAPGHVAALRWPAEDRRARPLPLANPMSIELSVMRTALIGNLLAALARSRSHGTADVRLFEVGRIFLPTDAPLPEERLHVAGVLAGGRPGWLVPSGAVDVFDVKGVVERLLAELLGPAADRVDLHADGAMPWLHPGVSARLTLDGVALGGLGEVDPRTRAAFGLDAPCFGFELDLEPVPELPPRQMRPIPRFPAVTRDLSFLVDAAVPAARVQALLAAPGDPPAEAVALLEDYRDPAHVPPGKKGMLWSVTYRSYERTLTDAEVDARHEAHVKAVLADLGATRR
jgi:phenylalanyl-tRNA synthetase beta chain